VLVIEIGAAASDIEDAESSQSVRLVDLDVQADFRHRVDSEELGSGKKGGITNRDSGRKRIRGLDYRKQRADGGGNEALVYFRFRIQYPVGARLFVSDPEVIAYSSKSDVTLP
jgi:hypothetical protein